MNCKVKGSLRNVKIIYILFLYIFSSVIFAHQASANNLSVSGVAFGDRDPVNDKLNIKFNLSWENSWKTKINHDAIWLTVRLNDTAVSPVAKKLCELTVSGLNPTGTYVGSDSNLEIYVPADKKGAFIRPKNYGIQNTVISNNVQLTVDYSSCGFDDTQAVNVSVFGLEMVFVPEGAFYAGDQGISTASLVEGSSDNDPWYITNAGPLSISNAVTNGFRYVSNGNALEDSTGASFTLADTYPNGYPAFYAMKYEVTEGQWVEFVNSLSTAQAREAHDLTDNLHKNTDSVQKRNTINCSGSPLVCTTTKSSRAVSYLSWMDLAAFLDWAALRPMTELEFEKASRGPLFSVQGEYVWGSTTIAAASVISGSSENGTETITNDGANANFDNVTFSGGDSANGPEYGQGPLRTGIFAGTDSTRQLSGASYYGILDLSGNLRERVVTIGNSSGRAFQGTNGDGYLTSLTNFEGNANELDWPGLDAVPSKGVTGAQGSGFKGGSWSDASTSLRISDRTDAANASTASSNNAGGRGVRSYDGT